MQKHNVKERHNLEIEEWENQHISLIIEAESYPYRNIITTAVPASFARKLKLLENHKRELKSVS